jgi:hypothetical protein
MAISGQMPEDAPETTRAGLIPTWKTGRKTGC